MTDADMLRAAGYIGPTVNDVPATDDPRQARVDVRNGRMARAVDDTLAYLRVHPEIYDLGGAIVRVVAGSVLPLDRNALAHTMGSTMQFVKYKPDGTPRLDDPPQRMVDQIMSLGAARGLRPLEAVVSIPTMRPDGTVLDVPGYDPASKLLYVADGEPPRVPGRPTHAEACAAYDALVFAFKEFPCVAPIDWAVLVTALITAVVRPALPTAPAVAFDAPAPGSGKTLLASSVATLASGDTPEPWPPVSARDDEEIRKRLFAALRTGTLAIIWDNVTGTLDSPSLAAFLTAARFQDRVLGRSETLALPNRAMFLITGNNVSLAGDMPRRVLRCRIDPRVEQPFARQFDLDPLEYVSRNRQALAVAALTIVRAWLNSGAQRAYGRVASFEKWDDYVRQPVAWLMGVDPLAAIQVGAADDPERESLSALLTALRACFGDSGFTAADVADVVRRCAQRVGPFVSDEHRALATAISDIAGRDAPSAKSIGRVLNNRRDRIVDGVRLEARPERNGNRWFAALTRVLEHAKPANFSFVFQSVAGLRV
jgi:hypothetical protein